MFNCSFSKKGFHSGKERKIILNGYVCIFQKDLANQERYFEAWWKSGALSRDPRTTRDPWDPPRPSGPPEHSGTPETPSNLRDYLGPQEPLGPDNLPVTTGILRNVMRGKNFSRILIRFLYSRGYNFSIIKISHF